MALTLLLTNDDGIGASGLRALREAVAPLGRAITVAPEREQSASSHAITLQRPLRIHEIAEDTFTVDGTPTDCVLAALNGLLDIRPDIVLSGINLGPNMGDDVTYSGTVSAAFEGAVLGLPAIALSLAAFRDHDFGAAPAVVPPIIDAVRRHGLPERVLLNVNIPNLPREELRGIRVTRLGHRVYHDSLVARKDPRGRDYYWIGGAEPSWTPEDGTDFMAVDQGYVSVTPLSVDLTHHRQIDEMKSWTFDDP